MSSASDKDRQSGDDIAIRPYRLDIAPSIVDDMRYRIAHARWPDDIDGDARDDGVPANFLRALTHYWQNRFDWYAAQESINVHEQFVATIDGLDLHFVHVRARNPDAMPLLITHGWPGSIIEFLDAIAHLTDPERFGGNSRDAFHVVAPSLQGVGASPAGHSGMTTRAMASRHARLMAALGYRHYIAQGGDWGSLITHWTAALDPGHCVGVHFNLLAPVAPNGVADPLALVQAHERGYLAAARDYAQEGCGYREQQRTRPRTLAYALHDSPVGWCAWVTEKFLAWCDCERQGQRDIRHAVSWDRLLANVSLYWLTGSIGSSLRLYREHDIATKNGEVAPTIKTPAGVACYPAEILRSPKAWAQARYRIVHWYEAPRGGHFPAMEQPELFAEDMRRFRGTLVRGSQTAAQS